MRALRSPLMLAWAALVLLSTVSTLLAVQPGRVAGVAVLLAGATKGRIILTRYLGLADAPDWRHGFDLVLALLILLLGGLYLAG